MKYSELISFKPIDSTIQLLETADKKIAKEMVQTYVMSDGMAECVKASVIDQLQMEDVIDNKGVMIVGNYGTGKSHLMSVIASIANDSDLLEYAHNKQFAKDMGIIAGKFEVLRLKIDGLTQSLREIIMKEIESDFESRGIGYKVPNLDEVRDNSRMIKEAMQAFQSKYPGKGYLIIIDELLAYLAGRKEKPVILDLAFLQSIAEMCSKSRIRLICGVQEKIFDNDGLTFVSDNLNKVGDRFVQMEIKNQDTAYVVSERILKKTPEQKAMIREHLEKFSKFYGGMSSRMDEFVDLFPIHPAYFDVFTKIPVVENRHILKNISMTIKDIFDMEVPADSPGVYSYDSYWTDIKSNGLLKSKIKVSKVIDASSQLEEIVNRSFVKAAYKPMAIQIIYALSVYRLTTKELDIKSGPTAENLRDDLCLYNPNLPIDDSDTLLSVVTVTLNEIMKTVSGQFIVHNESNNQYYIDVNKVVDYDARIKQKSSQIEEDDLNTYFFNVVYGCLEWNGNEYVDGFKIYLYDLNWISRDIYREGYLFMGDPYTRSTAQPERDFYIYIMPPYGDQSEIAKYEDDEVYFYFHGNDEFKENLLLYAAAKKQANISEGKDKDAYLDRSEDYKKKLVKYLSDNKATCFNVAYKRQNKQLIEVIKGKYNRDLTFKDAVDLASSICLDERFGTVYPDQPVMKTKITKQNCDGAVKAAFEYIAGRKNQQAAAMLQSFGILDGEKIRPEESKYAAYYINLLNELPSQDSVLNYSDIIEVISDFHKIYVDKKFRFDIRFTPIIILSLVYSGHAEILLKNNIKLTASNLDSVVKMNVSDLYEFKYVSKPSQLPLAELKKLFEILNINPTLINNPNDREKGVEELVRNAQLITNTAVHAENDLNNEFMLWGEPLANEQKVNMMRNAAVAVKNEFSNYSVKYNKPANLNHFGLSQKQIEELDKQIKLIKRVPEYVDFKNRCYGIVSYISQIENIDLGFELKSEIDEGKANFRKIRDSIMDGTGGEAAARKVIPDLEKIKEKYIDIYLNEHQKKRLGRDDADRRGKILESPELSNLRKLKSIDTLSVTKLSNLERDIADLKVCYTLTSHELKTNYQCPYCRFSLDNNEKNVAGQIDIIEEKIDQIVDDWTNKLLNTISDPVILNQKKFLKDDEAGIIDEFISSRKLPDKVDDFFVNSIKALLKGFEPVIIDIDEFMQKLEELPPMNESSFKEKINDIVEEYTKGKDAEKLRIVIKRKVSEE